MDVEWQQLNVSEKIIDVPLHFLCPISLQLMTDPVIVPTGITYDRDSIEKWLFLFKNTTCPVTKQPLRLCSALTPNHTLGRLIHSWCVTLNSSMGMELKSNSSQSLVDVACICNQLIDEGKSNPNLVASCIGRLRTICSVNERNMKWLEKAGGLEFLVSVIANNGVNASSASSGSDVRKDCLVDDALFLIHGIMGVLDATIFKNIAKNNNVELFVHSLVEIITCGTLSNQSRVHSILILTSLVHEDIPTHLLNIPPELFTSIVWILRENNVSAHAKKTAMKLLVEICPIGRNKIKAVEGSVVSTLIECLLQSSEKRINELSLTLLDQLCRCAEGRSKLINHEAGLAVVGEKVLRVSHGASERAVRVLSSISKHSANPMVLQEMLNVGVVGKMLMVLQVDCGEKMKRRCREMLSLHARVWRTSPCVSPHLLSYYPSA
uniref:U-box domain-containing protein n=1 Tax=Kalanchoe fedtschenkoi TaxID=63787 RepID=A0A7N0T317_KALFE